MRARVATAATTCTMAAPTPTSTFVRPEGRAGAGPPGRRQLP
ncbi:MAG: hypothetical protein ACRD0A_20585 [Acidimicrobiales bacterium]